MLVRLSDSALVPDLVAFLQRHYACVARLVVGAHEVEVTLLGSWHPSAARVALEAKLAEWQALRDAHAEIVG